LLSLSPKLSAAAVDVATSPALPLLSPNCNAENRIEGPPPMDTESKCSFVVDSLSEGNDDFLESLARGKMEEVGTVELVKVEEGE